MEWQCFCDASYYDMWCVRPVGESTFGEGFHLVQQAEAELLRDFLTRQTTRTELAEAWEQVGFWREKAEYLERSKGVFNAEHLPKYHKALRDLRAARATIHQLGENAAKAAGEYAERVAVLEGALQVISNPDWTWATPEEMRQCARAALTEPTDG